MSTHISSSLPPTIHFLKQDGSEAFPPKQKKNTEIQASKELTIHKTNIRQAGENK